MRPRDEEGELLAQIVANPEDVAPRLVYADWLQERGDLRGECIALLLQPKLDKKAQARLNDIFEPASRLIEGDIPAHGGIAFIERGLVEALYIGLAKLLKHGDRWFAQHPITSVKITNHSGKPTRGKLAELASSTVLAKIRTLELEIDSIDFSPLWESKRFAMLDRLEMSAIGVKPSPKGLANLALLRAPKLRSIRLYCIEGVERALTAIAANRNLKALETIEVAPGSSGRRGRREQPTDETFTMASLRERFPPAKAAATSKSRS
jgi:uncharacterized protein (TIGR02996 family)